MELGERHRVRVLFSSDRSSRPARTRSLRDPQTSGSGGLCGVALSRSCVSVIWMLCSSCVAVWIVYTQGVAKVSPPKAVAQRSVTVGRPMSSFRDSPAGRWHIRFNSPLSQTLPSVLKGTMAQEGEP